MFGIRWLWDSNLRWISVGSETDPLVPVPIKLVVFTSLKARREYKHLMRRLFLIYSEDPG